MEAFEVDQHITARSRYYAGRMGSRFYTVLRDEQRILGVTCRKCNQVFWPPRSTCGRCFSKLSAEDMREIGPEGNLVSFTKVYYAEPVHPRPAPFVYGIVKLDGADTGMAHFIDDACSELEIGMRVKAVFAEKRHGNILDIECFRPV